MGIAAPHHGFSPIARQQGRGRIVDSGYLSIQRLQGWKEFLKKLKIEIRAPARQTRKHVVDAEEEFALVEIRGQRGYVLAAALQFNMVALFDAIHSGVDLGAAGCDACHFFAQEEIGIAPKIFRGVNRIVIGDRNQVHAAPFQGLVNGFRIAVAFAAKSGE